MEGEFDSMFCNGGEFCMRVRERLREEESTRVLLGFWRRKPRDPQL